METIGDRIRRARERLWPRGQAELAKRMGVTRKTVSRWETGTCVPPAAAMEKLAQVLGVRLAYLTDGEDSGEGRMRCTAVPLLSAGDVARYGGGGLVGVQVEEEVWVPEAELWTVDPDRRPFAMRMAGDSMASGGIIDGAILLVNPGVAEWLRDGDVAVARLRGGEIVVKRVYFRRGGGIELASDDPTYRALSFSPDEVRMGDCVILGGVVFILSKPRRKL